jgi:hypothetical protein
MSEPGDEKLDPSETASEPDDSLRSMLRGAMREEGPAPDVLAGVQKKLRERSKGKFYADGWSTAKHPPLNTYLITSLLMLAVLVISYALLSPMVGSPEPVRNQPAPVQVIPSK